MPSHDPERVERALVQSLLDLADHRLDAVAAEMASDIDRYRDDWSTRTAEMQRAHQARLAEVRAETDQYIKSLYGEADEPAPTPIVGQGYADAPATGPAPAPGPGPGQPPSPYEAEFLEGERIRALPMAEYAAERQRLIRPNQGVF
jgi:hypothetical protein